MNDLIKDYKNPLYTRKEIIFLSIALTFIIFVIYYVFTNWECVEWTDNMGEKFINCKSIEFLGESKYLECRNENYQEIIKGEDYTKCSKMGKNCKDVNITIGQTIAEYWGLTEGLEEHCTLQTKPHEQGEMFIYKYYECPETIPSCDKYKEVIQ